MHVQIAQDVVLGDQFRQLPGLSPAELLAGLPQFRRKHRQFECPVDFFLRGTGHSLFVLALDAIDAVFVDFQPSLLGTAAQCDVVFFRSGEILQRSAE